MNSHYLTLNPNDSASPFIDITRVTGYEITTLSLTYSPSFAGKKKVSRLDHFQAGVCHVQPGMTAFRLDHFQTGLDRFR